MPSQINDKFKEELQQSVYTQFARTIMEVAGDQIFSVTFIKRSDGRKRKMVCRFKKRGRGAKPAYDAISKGLLPVWDMQKQGWRNINLVSIIAIKIDHVTYYASGEVDAEATEKETDQEATGEKETGEEDQA